MIKVEHLTKKFKEKVIFEDINCTLETGKTYAIVGKSGAGKTTFLNVLSGLEQPSSGKVVISDLTVNGKIAKNYIAQLLALFFKILG